MTGTALQPRDASPGTRLLLACGIAGPVLFWILGAIAAATWPGYDPVSQSMADRRPTGTARSGAAAV